MRITGGKLGGRRITVPRNGVRPTTDRVREALFSILAPELPGRRFLDLFAGSGVVGLEALSRGAIEACWVEEDRRTLGLLKDTISALGIENGRTICGKVERVLKRVPNPEPYDLIFADAPYGWERAPRGSESPEHPMIPALVKSSGCLAEAGLLIVERAAEEGPLPNPGWTVVDHRTYGGSGLTFYREDLTS